MRTGRLSQTNTLDGIVSTRMTSRLRGATRVTTEKVDGVQDCGPYRCEYCDNVRWMDERSLISAVRLCSCEVSLRFIVSPSLSTKPPWGPNCKPYSVSDTSIVYCRPFLSEAVGGSHFRKSLGHEAL